ncbi:MAG: cisplatin damage response ATP-dependent DNA ligase [Alphaproteobacteria bacterium]|nr:cisplatin damage response ATP-dependent DNA ligase [Alphaproteobacteria bacterium]
MNRFAALLDRLVYAPQRTVKLRAIERYLRDTPDPDRGYALAALTGSLSFKHAKAGLIRTLAEARVDPVLFRLSYDYVGDLAETVALIWPQRRGANRAPELSEIVAGLEAASKAELPGLVEGWLDALDADGRWALIKLMTGSLRVGVSGRLAKTAAAAIGGVEPDEIELVWPGLHPPYTELFAWLEGRSERPRGIARAPFRPVMLAHALEERDLAVLKPGDFAAEWKWDGIRVQAVSDRGEARLYTRTGEDISAAFPDVVGLLGGDASIDGELLVFRDGEPASFNDLQQRLNRKTVTKAVLQDYPAGIRAYDILHLDGTDLRPLPYRARRARLEDLLGDGRERLDLSPLVPVSGWEDLQRLRANPPSAAAEGLMLKRWESSYLPGRVRGEWFKWKRDPRLVDAVLMYAQRGHGKRSSYYSDYTFGVWRGEELVPVGKAYFGFTDEELKEIDRFVRANTVNSFGPVREVAHTRDLGLVLEVAFEGLARSPRHKSGVAMRFPRISRLRWDKPPKDADRLETLEAMLPG